MNPLHKLSRRGAVVTGVDKFDGQRLSGAGSSPAGSISRVLNSQKLLY